MRVGIDFDNTIVSYDRLFYRVALDEGLIPAKLSATKNSVRAHLRSVGREEDWIRLQGEVYGARMNEAELFPGALEFIAACRARSVPVAIISHKTRRPYRGPGYDLHAAARGFLGATRIVDPSGAGLVPTDVWFEETKEGKLRRIAAWGCTDFIDDLPEFLAEPAFPAGVRRLLFDPSGSAAEPPAGTVRLGTWGEVAGALGLDAERPA